jgi:hypothetical protein
MSTLSYLKSVTAQFQYYKKLGEGAMSQLEDDGLFWQPNPEVNSISIIVSHLHGNMLSRWTNFLTEDGEKPWRQRDVEFEGMIKDRNELMVKWEQGWQCLFAALDSINDQDLEEIVYIRNEGHTILEAINRQLAHYPYHVGQMVHIAKTLKDESWETLSIARNKSSQYNSDKFSVEKGIRHFTEDVRGKK